MSRFQSMIDVNATPDEVWRVMSAVGTWPSWLPTVTKVTPLDGIELVTGRRFAVEQPGLRPATYLATLVEPPYRFVWEAYSPGVKAVADHSIAPASTGGVSVTLSLELKGFLAWLGRMFAGRLIREYLRTECRSLKERVEASH